MNRCPIVSTPSEPAECIEQDCQLWDKMRHQCLGHTIPICLEALTGAFDNLARSINQAVLMKLKPEWVGAGACPKCGAVMMYLEDHRECTSCDYSDPYK